jgi:hypothetical protein
VNAFSVTTKSTGACRWRRFISAVLLAVGFVPAITDGQSGVVIGPGALRVEEAGPRVTVSCAAAPGWKAVVEANRGGVITEFRWPAESENLVSNDGGRFEGLIYADFKETGKDGDYVAKGALYAFGKVSTLSVMERSASRVVVEVEGTSGNQVSPKADVLRYRQRYTFLADRIECAGEMEWLPDLPQLRPELRRSARRVRVCLFSIRKATITARQP